MRIAFVVQPWDEVRPGIGGKTSIAILIYQIARCLARSHDVVVYGAGGILPGRETRDADGLRHRRIPVWPDRLLVEPIKLVERWAGYPRPKRPWFTSPWYHRGYIAQVARDLRGRDVDVVHVVNFSQYMPLLRRALPRARLVLHMECEWLSQLDERMIDERLAAVDRIIGCSEFVTERVRTRFPHHAERCAAVFNGVDVERFVERFDEGDGAGRLLFVARVSPEKGVHVLLDAFRRVREKHPQARLDIVGGGGLVPYEFVLLVSDDPRVAELEPFYERRGVRADYRAQLEASLSDDEVSAVSFRGSIAHPQLVDLYRRADVFVFPSVWDEPFGIPLVEAMASGLPVVATRGGGITEIVEHERTGLLVERGDAEALAGAILRLLDDATLRRAMGRAGRERAVRCFSWERVAQDLLAEYQRAEAGSAQRPV